MCLIRLWSAYRIQARFKRPFRAQTYQILCLARITAKSNKVEGGPREGGRWLALIDNFLCCMASVEDDHRQNRNAVAMSSADVSAF